MDLQQLLRFEIGGNEDAGNADVSLTCRQCTWTTWIAVGTEDDGPAPSLADLIMQAEEHECDGPTEAEA